MIPELKFVPSRLLEKSGLDDQQIAYVRENVVDYKTCCEMLKNLEGKSRDELYNVLVIAAAHFLRNSAAVYEAFEDFVEVAECKDLKGSLKEDVEKCLHPYMRRCVVDAKKLYDEVNIELFLSICNDQDFSPHKAMSFNFEVYCRWRAQWRKHYEWEVPNLKKLINLQNKCMKDCPLPILAFETESFPHKPSEDFVKRSTNVYSAMEYFTKDTKNMTKDNCLWIEKFMFPTSGRHDPDLDVAARTEMALHVWDGHCSFTSRINSSRYLERWHALSSFRDKMYTFKKSLSERKSGVTCDVQEAKDWARVVDEPCCVRAQLKEGQDVKSKAIEVIDAMLRGPATFSDKQDFFQGLTGELRSHFIKECLALREYDLVLCVKPTRQEVLKRKAE